MATPMTTGTFLSTDPGELVRQVRDHGFCLLPWEYAGHDERQDDVEAFCCYEGMVIAVRPDHELNLTLIVNLAKPPPRWTLECVTFPLKIWRWLAEHQ